MTYTPDANFFSRFYSGSVSIDPVRRYNLYEDFNGMDTLTYEVCDNGSPVLCDTAHGWSC